MSPEPPDFWAATSCGCSCEQGHEVQGTCRDQGRLGALAALDAGRVQADVCDHRSLRRAFQGADVVFHTAGFVGYRLPDQAWRVNAESPQVAVEAAADAGCRRIVLTSSISAIGLPDGERPADEGTAYPNEWLGLTYPDSKHEGERVAQEAAGRRDIELVVVNPAYALGVPVDCTPASSDLVPDRSGTISGARLPAVIAAPMNFVGRRGRGRRPPARRRTRAGRRAVHPRRRQH